MAVEQPENQQSRREDDLLDMLLREQQAALEGAGRDSAAELERLLRANPGSAPVVRRSPTSGRALHRGPISAVAAHLLGLDVDDYRPPPRHWEVQAAEKQAALWLAELWDLELIRRWRAEHRFVTAEIAGAFHRAGVTPELAALPLRNGRLDINGDGFSLVEQIRVGRLSVADAVAALREAGVVLDDRS